MNWRHIFRRKRKGPQFICRQVVTLLMDYLNGETDPATTASIDRHLQECANCLHFLESYRKTSRLLRKIDYEEIPEEFRRRLEETLRQRLQGR